VTHFVCLLFRTEDSLVKSIEENEDSVYAVAWGASNTVFASLSYDGRVMANTVPKELLK
jgi:hypothetical protein